MKKPTDTQYYVLTRMSQGWTLLHNAGASYSLRDSRDVHRKSVSARTVAPMLGESWITRTYVLGSGVRYKITAPGKWKIAVLEGR